MTDPYKSFHPLDDSLSVSLTAKIFSVTPRTIRHWLASSYLRAVPGSKPVKIPIAAIEHVLARCLRDDDMLAASQALSEERSRERAERHRRFEAQLPRPVPREEQASRFCHLNEDEDEPVDERPGVKPPLYGGNPLRVRFHPDREEFKW